MTNIKREWSIEATGYLAPGKSSSWVQSVLIFSKTHKLFDSHKSILNSISVA